jgi:nucleoside-diphosphate-sugar epimerase
LKILVTGAEGFTGKYFIKTALAHGHEVVGLKSNLLQVDALESEVLSVKPNAIVHLAAISFVGHGSVNDFYIVNTIGALNLFTAVSKLSILPELILVASSANVYGNCEHSPISESQPFNPLNDYAVSKVAMEYVAKLWMDKLPILIARPFNYTGVGQAESFLIPKIVSHFINRAKVIELGNLDVAREFLDVRDVALIYMKLIEKSIKNDTINICTGVTYQLKDIIHLAEDITGHCVEVKVNAKYVRNNELKLLCGDNTKLERMLDLNVKFTPLRETIEWMINEGNV